MGKPSTSFCCGLATDEPHSCRYRAISTPTKADWRHAGKTFRRRLRFATGEASRPGINGRCADQTGRDRSTEEPYCRVEILRRLDCRGNGYGSEGVRTHGTARVESGEGMAVPRDHW